MPIRWFLELSKHRKVLLLLAGGMLTLVFDAFIPHWKWNRGGMKWNQWIPIVYGVGAFFVLLVPGLFQLRHKTENAILWTTGILGLLTGGGGVYFHLAQVFEALAGETLTFQSVGQVLKDSAPVFAPAAFAGIGLLLITIKRLTSAHVHADVGRRSRKSGEQAPAAVIAMGERPE